MTYMHTPGIISEVGVASSAKSSAKSGAKSSAKVVRSWKFNGSEVCIGGPNHGGHWEVMK